MNKKEILKREYQIIDDVKEEFPNLISIIGVLMDRVENSYVPVEPEIRKSVLKNLRERNLSSSIKNRIIDNLKDLVKVEQEEFFTHEEWIVPFQNGYYDVKIKKFIQYHEKNFFYEIPHNYDFKKDYNCHTFKQSLKNWIGSQKNVNEIKVDDIFEIMGYCMTMNTNLKKAVYIYGPTQTGKTTFQSILLHLIGDKNTANISLWRMQKDQFGTDGLQLKILNTIGETSNKKIPDVSYFKQITGGDKFIAVESKGEKKGRFICTVKLLFLGNKLPDLVDRNDQAFYDRWIIVNFNKVHKISKDKFSDFIISNPDEVQGILHECIKGLLRLYDRGNFREDLIQNNKHIWDYNSDNFYKFLQDKCVFEWEGSIDNKLLDSAYVRYVVDNNLGDPISSKLITKELRRYKILMKMNYDDRKRVYKYEGIRFKSKEEKTKEKEVIKEMEELIEEKEEEYDYEAYFDYWQENQREKYFLVQQEADDINNYAEMLDPSPPDYPEEPPKESDN